MQNEEVYIRRGHIIVHPDGNNEPLKSINAAKRRSREIQKAGNKLRVEAHKPNPLCYGGRGPKAGVNETRQFAPKQVRRAGIEVKVGWKVKSEG